MNKDDDNKTVEPEQKALKYAERILPETEDTLIRSYRSKEKTGFRFMHKPMQETDHYPVGVRKELNPSDDAPRVSDSDNRSKWTTENRKKNAISEHAGLSNFETPEGAANVIGKKIEKARATGGDDEAALVAEEYGEYICQFDYKKTSGLVGESNKNKHFDFLPFADWSPEQDFNEKFGYQHYTMFYKFEE